MNDKTDHYFSKKQSTPFKPSKIRMRVAGLEFDLQTAGGVFSPKKLDNGTQLLIENAHVEQGWKVLDLGCGYGVLGVAIKKLNPTIELFMSDVNQRAIKLVRMNLKMHNIEGEAIQSDAFSSQKFKGLQFDTIFLNPPQSAGKDICFKLIEESKDHLFPGGTLQLVARHQKGGKHLSAKMEEVFGNVEEVAKGSGFRIYVSSKEVRVN